MPTSIDPTGVHGPSRGSAQRSRWRRTSPGLFVPTTTTCVVEQRIVEAWAAVPASLVTGWAALRLYGGGFFDGLERNGVGPMPVPLLVPHAQRRGNGPGREVIRVANLPAGALAFGIQVTRPERSVVEAMRMADSEREAIVVCDMALAARITTIEKVADEIASPTPVKGLPRVRRALGLADAHCRSPQESRLRLTWLLDAGFPPPLMNRGVWDLTGDLIGVPDLFDPEAGVCGEYDGAFHRDRARHRRDVHRWEGFRAVGLETFTVVAGDRPSVVVQRMRAARDRALWLPARSRRWTLEPRGLTGSHLDGKGMSLMGRLDTPSALREV
jgi:hypothetical protein